MPPTLACQSVGCLRPLYAACVRNLAAVACNTLFIVRALWDSRANESRPQVCRPARGVRALSTLAAARQQGGPMEAWKVVHAEQLRALGLPCSLLGALYEQTQAEQRQADPFERRGAGVFVRPQSETKHTRPKPDLRVVELAGVLPLCDAAAAAAAASLRLSAAEALRLSTPRAAAANESVRDVWLRGVPVHAVSSGCGQESLALLDPLAEKVRHSAHATHRLGVFHPGKPRQPVSVMWRIAPGEGAVEEPGVADASGFEVTRDYLHGRYLLDTPSMRALQSLPWLSQPALWHTTEELRACEEELQRVEADRAGAAGGEQVRAAAAEARAAAAGRLPSSASGRQVFLSWLAQNGGQAKGASPAQPMAGVADALALAVGVAEAAGSAGVGRGAPQIEIAPEIEISPRQPAHSGPARWRVFTDLAQVTPPPLAPSHLTRLPRAVPARPCPAPAGALPPHPRRVRAGGARGEGRGAHPMARRAPHRLCHRLGRLRRQPGAPRASQLCDARLATEPPPPPRRSSRTSRALRARTCSPAASRPPTARGSRGCPMPTHCRTSCPRSSRGGGETRSCRRSRSRRRRSRRSRRSHRRRRCRCSPEALGGARRRRSLGCSSRGAPPAPEGCYSCAS